MSSTTFVKEWAATSRGVTNAVAPSFNAARLFPPTELKGFGCPEPETKNVVIKRFVFSKANIAALREEIVASRDGDSLDKPETIFAFIWKRLIDIVRSKQQNTKPILAIQAVNLRGRMDPPLPEHSLGNLWWYAIASTPIEEEGNYEFLIKQMRKAIKEIDSEMVKGLQNLENMLQLTMEAARTWNSREIEFCTFTIWCRFPLYEIDFEWGRPSWVGSPGRPYKNLAVLMPTGGGDCGEGVEAWIGFEEEVMASFERDPELLTFTS